MEYRCQCPSNLRDLEAMRKPGTEEIAFVGYEYLCFILKLAERIAMQNPVAVPLKAATRVVIIFLVVPSKLRSFFGCGEV